MTKSIKCRGTEIPTQDSRRSETLMLKEYVHLHTLQNLDVRERYASASNFWHGQKFC